LLRLRAGGIAKRNPCWTTVAGREVPLHAAGADCKMSDTVQPLPSINPISTTASRCRMKA